MNYRHAYHAGNFADVFKHSVLFALLEILKAKDAPFALIDTHAGSGCYALDSQEADKTGEYRDGIARLLFPDLEHSTHASLPPLLRRWLDAILALPGNEHGLKRYPGSPLQAALTMRAMDSAHLCELHPEEISRLRALFGDDRRVHVHHRNGYEALGALLPPLEKRGMVLIDPPYEAQEDEFRLIEAALKKALSRWPNGIYAIWHPIKLRNQLLPFLRWLQHCGARRLLKAQLLVHPADSPLRLNGAGMLILNAPWNLDRILREPLRTLACLLSQKRAAQWHLDWLIWEGDRQASQAPPAPPLPSGGRTR